MAHLKICKDNYIDSTVISNRFIDEYMKDANDAQLKVYLYLIRMLNASEETSVPDIAHIADKFNHTEKEVVRALKYWEKKQLISIYYDEEGNPVEIRLQDIAGGQPSRCASVTRSSEEEQGTVPPTPFPSASVKAQAEPAPFDKPSFSPDQLREFKNRQNTAQLLFIVESYIGKPLAPSEIKTILFFTDVLHFSDDLIDYLVQYCVDRGKKNFKYIEKVAINWAEEGIRTPKQAEKMATRYDAHIYAIMNELGKSNSPTAKELEFITRWIQEYGFTNDIIFEACERTVMATDKHRFEYAEGILSNWKKENVHSKVDIRRIDDLYQQRRRSSTKPGSTNKFNQFPQNQYDFEQLEKELLSN